MTESKARNAVWQSIPWVIVATFSLWGHLASTVQQAELHANQGELERRRIWMEAVQDRLQYRGWKRLDHELWLKAFCEANGLQQVEYRSLPDPDFPPLPVLPEKRKLAE